MQQACLAVRSFVCDADAQHYDGDLMLRSAVERQLQNIGEALSQLARLDPVLAAKVPEHRLIIDFRNVLLHGYAGLNNAEIWRVIQHELPQLQVVVEAFLQEAGPPPNP